MYSLTYGMLTGRGLRISGTAGEAMFDHAALLQAGATGIVIRDDRLLVVTLAKVAEQEKLETSRSASQARSPRLDDVA